MTGELAVFALAAVAAGAVVGVLAGLFGIGGGLVLVPVLFELMQALGADESTALRAALATSLATVVATGLRAAASHHRRGSLDFALVRAWAPAMVIGAGVGAELATRIDTTSLLTLFAIVTMMLALNMAFGRQAWRLGTAPPSRGWRNVGGGIVGALAAMVGIGVAGLGVPLMTLFNAPVLHAVAAAALIGALAAVPACIRFAIAGWDVAGLPPYSLGYVNLLGCALIVPATMLAAPLGAAWSQRVDATVLARAFAVFLALNAVRMACA